MATNPSQDWNKYKTQLAAARNIKLVNPSQSWNQYRTQLAKAKNIRLKEPRKDRDEVAPETALEQDFVGRAVDDHSELDRMKASASQAAYSLGASLLQGLGGIQGLASVISGTFNQGNPLPTPADNLGGAWGINDPRPMPGSNTGTQDTRYWSTQQAKDERDALANPPSPADWLNDRSLWADTGDHGKHGEPMGSGVYAGMTKDSFYAQASRYTAMAVQYYLTGQYAGFGSMVNGKWTPTHFSNLYGERSILPTYMPQQVASSMSNMLLYNAEGGGQWALEGTPEEIIGRQANVMQNVLGYSYDAASGTWIKDDWAASGSGYGGYGGGGGGGGWGSKQQYGGGGQEWNWRIRIT